MIGHESEQAPGNGEDREAYGAAVHGVAKSDTISDNWTMRWFPRFRYYDGLSEFSWIKICSHTLKTSMYSPLAIKYNLYI